MKHYIEINEQHRKVFAVEADSEEDAINRVEAAYDTGSITVTDSETVFLSYNAVRNRQDLERLVNSGSYSVLPDRPTTYTAEYTLTINLSDTESRDISCKAYDYKSIDEARDDSTTVIAEMLQKHKLPDGTYTLDAGYEEKTVTGLSHNLTGVKTILSVRAHRQHLFVLDKIILTLIKILFSARSTSTTPPTVRCSLSFLINSIQQICYKIAACRQLSFLFVLTLLRQNGD